MLEGSKEHQERSGKIIKFQNDEFYTAIMDEDLGRIEDMSKKYGSNFVNKIQDEAPGELFWKVNATIFKKKKYLWELKHVKCKFHFT